MTEAQRIDRIEREGIMIHDGGCSEPEAIQYCDSRPDIYGIRDVELMQDMLI